MHAIQTSGNCIRNVTADHFAGAAADEIGDPRPCAEIIRQWSTLHPGVLLPAAQVQDRGDRAPSTIAPRSRSTTSACSCKRIAAAASASRSMVGGGLGRTPYDRPADPRLPAARRSARYLEAVCASTICTAGATTSTRRASRSWCTRSAPTSSRAQVEDEWQRIREGALKLPRPRCAASTAYFAPPDFERRPAKVIPAPGRPPALRAGSRSNTHTHKQPGYAIVNDLAEARRRHPGRCQRRADGRHGRSGRALFSIDELRVTHEQNLVLPHVRNRRLCRLSTPRWKRSAWPTANAGLITDIIACPGLDYCALANARSIPIAQASPSGFADLDARTRSASSRSRSPAASMPAAITMSATSAFSASTRTARNSTSSSWAARARRTPASATSSAPASARTTSSTRSSGWSTAISSCARTASEVFLAAYNRLGPAPFKEALYAAAIAA